MPTWQCIQIYNYYTNVLAFFVTQWGRTWTVSESFSHTDNVHFCLCFLLTASVLVWFISYSDPEGESENGDYMRDRGSSKIKSPRKSNAKIDPYTFKVHFHFCSLNVYASEPTNTKSKQYNLLILYILQINNILQEKYAVTYIFMHAMLRESKLLF